MDSNPPASQDKVSAGAPNSHTAAPTASKKPKFGRPFWKSPIAIGFVIVFALVAGYFVFKSFAAATTLTKTWDTNSDWNTGTISPGNSLAVANGSVSLKQRTLSTTNLAAGRPTSSSATQAIAGVSTIASNAVDSSMSTRWVSSYASTAGWITVDLGSVYAIRHVQLNWAPAYAKSYHVDGSNDGVNWTPLWSTTGGAAGNADIYISSGSARFVRIYGTVKALPTAGYSLYDMKVFGAPTYFAPSASSSTGNITMTYNAGTVVDWTGLAPYTTLNGDSITLQLCTSSNGTNWGNCTNDMGRVVNSQYIRITATLHTTTRTSTPTFDKMILIYNTISSSPPPPSTLPPTTAITAPVPGAAVTGTITINANAASSAGVAISKVEFYDGTTLIGTDTTAPYSISWNTTTAAKGTNNLTTKAYDSIGSVGISAAVPVTVSGTTTTPPPTSPPPPTSGTLWQPTAAHSITWDWQLQGTIPTNKNVQVFDIDGFDNTAATVSALHATGTKVICYIDVGTAENFRSDFASFPASVQGSTNGWPGEKWLDVRQLSVLEPIMIARMQMCKSKGFDALEPDNIDGFENSTGFPLTAQDQLTYNTWIATEAHALGLSVGLKNDGDQASQLVSHFDWALNEQCNQYSECNVLAPFTSANKAVFNAEYSGGTGFCSADTAAHINGALFDLNLTGSTYTPCPGTW